MTTFKTFIVLLSISAFVVDAGTPGTTRCEEKHNLSHETLVAFDNWQVPKEFRTKDENCHMHCVFEELGWMKGHTIMDDQINSDLDPYDNDFTTHLRTLLFEDCEIWEDGKRDKCKKANEVYKCLAEGYKPLDVLKKAFERAKKRSEQ
ncbi:uncharacterized protein LOC134832151 [Culicoides brevitarsis]|uniref:uncharacterized protein LOC134832151 n=1 Tax=Culicoides brevitarsis TaxID=469753 RepID=UPI00307B6C88